jgi:hypothetical protein
MAKAKKAVRKRKTAKKSKYVCYHCGTQVVMDSCGLGFRHLVCCGKAMRKKA